MSRIANDSQLTELANSLRHVKPLSGCPEPRSDLRYCQGLPGHLWRVCRSFSGRVTVLGVTPETHVAAFFADCVTLALWPYHSNSSTGLQSALNYTGSDFDEMIRLMPSVSELSKRVMRHLICESYIGNLETIQAARILNQQVISDLQEKLARSTKQIADEIHRASVSYSKLFKL